MVTAEDFDGEIMEVTIEDPDVRAQGIAEIEAEAPENEDESRLLLLTRGRTARQDKSNLVEMQGTDDGQHRVLVVTDTNEAVGIYLHILEQHGFEEERTYESMSEIVDLDAYEEWRTDLSRADRQERLLTQMRDRAPRSPHVERYLDRGSWRTVDPDDETAQSIGQKLYDAANSNPRRCYRNAIAVLNSVQEVDSIQYTEGMSLPKQGGRGVAHAWLEVNETVIELTWPWHAPVPPSETVYYGVPLDTEEVLETTRQRNLGYNPILLTVEELAQG